AGMDNIVVFFSFNVEPTTIIYTLSLHAALPISNAAHSALAALERAGRLAGVITQNVDRLHHAAGSRRVVELHGALPDVRCLACGDRKSTRPNSSHVALPYAGFCLQKKTSRPLSA